MSTLITLKKGEGEVAFAARWRTDDGISFNALHDSHGKPMHAVRPFGIKLHVPHLTAAQMETAVPLATPAPSVSPRDLAAKGTAACPHLAKRMNKAADLVEAGAVRLISDELAVVSSSQDYDISGERCTCDWQKHHPGDHCSHSLAVRMARALGQAHEPHSEDEKEARSAAIAQASQDYKLRRNAEVQMFARERDRQRRDYLNSPQAARRYVHMATANGAKTIRPDIMNRAQPGLNNL